MAKRFTETDKWKKKFIKSLPSDYKLLWLYILDDCNHAGVWDVDVEVASLRIGVEVNEQTAIEMFGNRVYIFDDESKWFIPNFLDFQYGELNPSSRVHQSAIKVLEKYDLLEVYEDFLKGMLTLSHRVSDTLKDKVKEKAKAKVKNKVKRFAKPNIEEIQEYCTDRGNFVDAAKFYDYYSSNGWKVGKNPMKDWKAAIRTWEKNTVADKGKSKVQQSLDTWQEARNIINNG